MSVVNIRLLEDRDRKLGFKVSYQDYDGKIHSTDFYFISPLDEPLVFHLLESTNPGRRARDFDTIRGNPGENYFDGMVNYHVLPALYRIARSFAENISDREHIVERFFHDNGYYFSRRRGRLPAIILT